MTLFEAAGGAPAMLALATDFHARCLADPVLEHPFSHHLNPEHVQRLAHYWGEVFGGPPVFSTTCGGHSGMLGVHANQGAEGDLGNRFVACFDAAAASIGLPTDVRAAMGRYIRWATAEVLTYSPADAVVPAGRPMPRWDFAGLTTP